MNRFTPQQLAQAVAFDNPDPETEDEIAHVERKLGVRFPDSYRELLAIGGEGHMGPVSTPADNDLHFDFLAMKRERFAGASVTIIYAHKRLLKSAGDMRKVIPFGDVGNGDHICFDYRSSSAPTIVLWNHEEAFSSPDPLIRIAESFDQLLELALKNG